MDFINNAFYDLRFAFLFLAVAVVAMAAAWRLELFTPAHISVMRRNLRARGLIDTAPLAERIGRRVPFLEQVGREINVTRLLAIAGKDETPSQWMTTTGLYGGVVALLIIGMLVVEQLTGTLSLPPLLGLVIGVAVMALRVIGLRSEVGKRQKLLALELGDMLPMLSALMSGRGVRVMEGIALLGYCTTDRAVYGVVHAEQWRRLVDPRRDDPKTEWQVLRTIGREYDVPQFHRLSQVVRTFTESGVDARREMTVLASEVFDERLEQNKRSAARNKVVISIAMMGMLASLLGLIFFVLIVRLTGSFAG